MGDCCVLRQRIDTLDHVINHCDHPPCATHSVRIGDTYYAAVKTLLVLNRRTYTRQSSFMWLTVATVAPKVPVTQQTSGATRRCIMVNVPKHSCKTAAGLGNPDGVELQRRIVATHVHWNVYSPDES